ncbi:hypothetical protein HDF16_001581 [Granulicella aggregans]|uniref:Peptidase M1 membrane alanine aminopeptidase domain-containing protein n=1 Tax=Granulicella aggregans TaxID=474949 RepID=A0A7W8E2Z3_9BACT|nr:M1 family aminopeptidase [Granulicella aggregans]MBB5056896.1 hypothetical protein [Granulicella aggregans]
MINLRSWELSLCLALVLSASSTQAQQPELARRPEQTAKNRPPAPLKAPDKLDPAHAPNANSVYQALRLRTVNGEAFTVSHLSFQRDAAVFTLENGTVYLYGPVSGITTGAVFLGEGSLHLVPPNAIERRQLKNVMKTEVLDQHFTSAVFAFTDATAEELRKASTGTAAGSGNAAGQGEEMRTLFRHDLKYDLEARLLEDMPPQGSTQPAGGGFFLAEMKGPLFSKRLIYMVDPHGAIGVAPEEVALLTSSEGTYDIALGFPSESQRKLPRPANNIPFRVTQQTIDANIERNGKLTATAVTAITATQSGITVLPLELFPTLRVSGVWGPSGEALDFIQEDKLRDAGFAVLLQKPLKSGESIQLTTAYAGKDAVLDMGNDNYYLVARESWYPNMRGALGNYAFYGMTFHTPKTVEVVATGNRVSEKIEGKQQLSVWQSNTPLAVAGFNLGAFQTNTSERNKDLQVISYANTSLAENYEGLRNSGMAVGTLSTTGMLKRATSEGDAAIQIYTEFFGPLQYDHVSLTQQTACNYGQSWPTLVYLPICYFWDSTIQHQIGVLDGDPSYWKVVTAHEVAHQWWGQTVGFASYRDQWMSEGFADFSASIFLLETNKTDKEYRDFWALLHKRLLEKNAMGYRPVDVGPVTMGTLVSNTRTGDSVYTSLIYPKGAFILHMLEMQFYTPQYGEKPFQSAMQDFVNSYRNQPATTEDFKAVMERHMTASMDIDHNHKLDWFFNAYVYGTETPKYTITSDFDKKGDDTIAHFKLTQSKVSPEFAMPVPLYLELGDKRTIFLGHMPIKGSSTVDQTVNLGKLTAPPVRLVLNYNYDLLSE